LNVDTGNLFDDIVDSRHSEADFFSEPWMYRLKESSPHIFPQFFGYIAIYLVPVGGQLCVLGEYILLVS
jgi:hypothetical protein